MRLFLLPAVVAVSLLAPAAADHCQSYHTTTPTLWCGAASFPGDHPVYVDDDCCPECLYYVWIYQESNGIPGLQREDEIVDDTCHGMIVGDTIVF